MVTGGPPCGRLRFESQLWAPLRVLRQDLPTLSSLPRTLYLALDKSVCQMSKWKCTCKCKSTSLHLSPSLSLFPWPVKIHTGTQPCGKSDKTSVELHRLRGMYVANDFQGLMMRKEVENWGEEREGWRQGEGGAEEKKKLELRESKKQSWTFWLLWRLLIKARYWSPSSLSSPPPWFSCLYCWPPKEKRAQSLNGRSLNKRRIAGIASVGTHEWMCFYVSVLWTVPITSYLDFILTQCIHRHCFPAMLYSAENQVRTTWCYGPFSLSYTKTRYTHRNEISFLHYVHLFLSIAEIPSCCALCNVLSSRAI